MVKQNKQVTMRHSAEIAVLYQHAGVKGKKLLDLFPQYSRTSVYRHAIKLISAEAPVDKRKFNKGRPRKLSVKDIRYIKRAIPKLREREGSFTSPRIAVEAGISSKVSHWTIRRALNEMGYFYLQSRKKGLLLATDLKKRVDFCNKVKQFKLGKSFWQNNIAFYLDG